MRVTLTEGMSGRVMGGLLLAAAADSFPEGPAAARKYAGMCFRWGAAARLARGRSCCSSCKSPA